jgi:hypothetical protein
MLTIVVPGVEAFDEAQEKFVTVGDFTLELEHSLVSLSKWESEFEKPFLDEKHEKSSEEILGYIKAMTMTPNVPGELWSKLSSENVDSIHKYIDAKMTATTVYELQEAPKTKKEIVTSEVIYYWMVVFNIPFECQYWHLNRLFTLIRVCSAKAEKPKKMSPAEIARRNRELNVQRRKKLGTRG